ncbi:MAG: L-ribulose-5-phosphate 4-epimerase AraD [Candidatus Hydrogenedentes bacterium]|nr:L-ribulose-5-phosphate 4-epimerase AraD [Candidatus Hydrogenedentota bacterium]
MADLKKSVCDANLDLVFHGLVKLTFGNASAIDREAGRVVIKPSGLAYEKMKPRDMVVVNLAGEVVEGGLKPSVDLPTHLALYEAFPSIGGIAHSHSHYATCWAQACRPIPCLGTTHADYFYGEIPVTEPLSKDDVGEDYERAIGASIVRAFADRDALECPGVLVANHAPFAWGETVGKAVENARVLEEIAHLALHTLALNPSQTDIAAHLLDKHFFRKHGDTAYYGQESY